MESLYQRETAEIDLRQIIKMLIRHIWLILFAGGLTGLLLMIYTKATMVPQYVSSTKIYVLNKDENATKVSMGDYQLGEMLAQDYLQMITSRTVTESVVAELKLNMRAEELAGKISVRMSEQSARIIEISVRDSDPYMAQKLTTTVQEMASKHIKEITNSEAVNVVEEANIPQAQVNGNLKKKGMIGFLAGAMLVCAILILRHLMDDTIKTEEDVEKYLEMSVLGMIPLSGKKEKKNKKRKAKAKSVQRQGQKEKRQRNRRTPRV